MNIKYIVGIDEAGRGPLAGPVAVGVTKLPENFDYRIFGKLRDSKKLSEKKREEFFKVLQKLKKEKEIDFSVALVSSTVIDQKGIVYAISKGIEGCLKKLQIDPLETKVLLDGGLRAPSEFVNQTTIIKGDESEPSISLASIVAKVFRDHQMLKYANKYPQYQFELHKGYGTRLHLSAIKKYGLSTIHRKSFCKNVI